MMSTAPRDLSSPGFCLFGSLARIDLVRDVHSTTTLVRGGVCPGPYEDRRGGVYALPGPDDDWLGPAH